MTERQSGATPAECRFFCSGISLLIAALVIGLLINIGLNYPQSVEATVVKGGERQDMTNVDSIQFFEDLAEWREIDTVLGADQ